MASAKKRIVSCSQCNRIMKCVTDVETQSDADHLYVMSAGGDMLSGLVKIGRSKSPLQRAIELQESQPFYVVIHALFWGMGSSEKEIHRTLAVFQVQDSPGQEWFELPVANACQSISRILFADVARVGVPSKRRAEEAQEDD